MPTHSTVSESYVIKALDLPACGHLALDCPKPRQLQWIDRGTDRALRQSTIQQLARTFHKARPSSSICRVQQSAGLRATFTSGDERNAFARYFSSALEAEREQRQHLVTAIFPDRELAHGSIAKLVTLGVPTEALCCMEKVAELHDDQLPRLKGYSLSEVGRTTLAGGLVGALLGAAILSVPGLGAIAVTGALVGQAVSLKAAILGIIGASGGAFSKMLSDCDVDGRSANHFAGLVARGAVLVTIDTRRCDIPMMGIQQMIVALGGHLAGRSWPFDLRLQANDVEVAQVIAAPAPIATPYGTPFTTDQPAPSALLRSSNKPTTSARPASEIHHTSEKNSFAGNQRATAA